MPPNPPVVRLSALCGGLYAAPGGDTSDPLVRGVSYDSRRVGPGDLFVCLRGTRDDGHRYALDAVGRGAVAVVAERRVDGLRAVPWIEVPEARTALARLAARFYGDPARRLTVTGITGTEGKTTTAYLLDAILRAAGCRTGLFGTIVNVVASRAESAILTTPESADLQRLLWECVHSGCQHVVMEVTSHALAMGRVVECEFDYAVFTNLHSDHLDFHGTPERYRDAKAMLFRDLGRGPAKAGRGVGVINADDPVGSHMRGVCSRPVVRFGMTAPADVRGELLAAELGRTVLRAETPHGPLVARLALTGPYTAANALAAIATAHAMGLELSTIRRGLESLALVPGRFEIVPNTAGILVVIDFAHTAAAFREVLGFLRTVAQGRIVAMFGCAGDRDRTKRPVIGELVASLADFVIVTTDNPASEDPADIAEEVLAGVRRVDPQGKRHLALLDRREAVRRAIALARPGDLVLLAGKGHEQVQIVDGARVPYSDRATVEEVLGARAEAPAATVAPLPPAG